MKVFADVEVVEVDGRRVRFKVSCCDEVEPIGSGTHERFIIDMERFMAKVGEKGG